LFQPSRCPRSSTAVFRRKQSSRPQFGSRRCSFTLRGRAHTRLATIMTASTSCERSSAFPPRSRPPCSLRSGKDAFTTLIRRSVPEVDSSCDDLPIAGVDAGSGARRGDSVFRQPGLPSSPRDARFVMVLRRSRRCAVGSQLTGSRSVFTFRRFDLRLSFDCRGR